MSIVSLILGLVKLADVLARYAANKQLIDAGTAQGLLQATSAAMGVLENARKGRDAMAGDGDWAERVRERHTRPDR